MAQLQDDRKGKQRATEILEVEDQEQRQERIQGLFAKMNAPGAVTSDVGKRTFDFGDRTTFTVEPPLELLSRVQAFLPELAASNTDLLRRAKEDPSSVDIEELDAEEPQYIEMNLGVGVFDHHGPIPAGMPVAEVEVDLDQAAQMDDSDSDADSASASSDDEDTDTTSDSDSEGDSSSDVDTRVVAHRDSSRQQLARAIKPLPKRSSRKPDIVVLSET
ncbi:hypothetical protein C8Q80DRAFT_147415 [Daedaleopsis nitida]|nr:hypothetical protein C8Q80DRAFT_147415 [Daedaleopsis nitida]